MNKYRAYLQRVFEIQATANPDNTPHVWFLVRKRGQDSDGMPIAWVQVFTFVPSNNPKAVLLDITELLARLLQRRMIDGAMEVGDWHHNYLAAEVSQVVYGPDVVDAVTGHNMVLQPLPASLSQPI